MGHLVVDGSGESMTVEPRTRLAGDGMRRLLVAFSLLQVLVGRGSQWLAVTIPACICPWHLPYNEPTSKVSFLVAPVVNSIGGIEVQKLLQCKPAQDVDVTPMVMASD